MTKLPPTWKCQHCGYQEYILTGEDDRALRRWAEHEQFCPGNPKCDTNSEFNAAQVFYKNLYHPEGM